MKFLNLSKKFKIKREYLALLVFAILIALFYSNTLMNGFVLDDIAVVVENTYIHSLRYLPKVVTGCIWEHALGKCKDQTLYYRPIHTLSYLLTYQISSKPWFFHLVNLFYFLAVVFLVFVLIKILTKNFFLSFITATLFLISPINNEVVNWISAVPELTFVIFILLTIIYYIKYRNTSLVRNLFFALLFYFLAMLSKETAVILPLILLSADLLLLKTSVRELIQWKRLKGYLLLAVPLLIYFLMRLAVIGGFGNLVNKRDHLGSFSLTERINTFFRLFIYYLKEILYPYPLIFFHDFKISSNLLNPQFIFSFFGFLSFFSLFYLIVIKRKNLIAFSLVWLFIFFLPIFLFFNIIGKNVFAENIFTERYLFAPGVSFALMVACFFNYLWQRDKVSKIIVSVLVISIIVTSFLVIYPRNKIWKDNLTLFRATLLLNPNAHPIREYLADELRERGDFETAKMEYEEILQRDPRYSGISHIYNNLGNYYREKGDLDKAQEYFEEAIQESEKIRNYKSYNNLGALYMEKEKYLKALLYFCQALQIAPDAPEPINNFNRVASMIASVEEENFIFLYMDVMDGEEFKKTAEEKIKYKRKFCAYDNCFYVFSPQLEEREIMLPFLIMAKAFPEEIVKIKNSSYNSESGEIILEVNKRYQDRVITFYFPTCDGVYYEVSVKSF